MSIATEIQRLQQAKADIKSAIEEKGVTVGDGTIDTYAAKIDEISGGSGDYEQGYEDGKNSVVNVGRFCRTITFTNLNIFGTKEVVLNLDNALLLEETFRRSVPNYFGYVPNETVEHITINCPNKIISMYYFCAGEYDSIEQKLKHITLNVDTQNAKNWNYAFRYVKSVEIIDGNPFDFSSATSVTRMFDQCTALKEMRFAPNTLKLSITIPNSPNLSTDTILSIIDGLADLTPRYYVAMQTGPDTYEKGELIENVISVTEYGKDANGETLYNVEYGIDPSNTFSTAAYKEGGGDAQTLTLHATVGNKLTDEQKATITAKNWTLVY